MNKKFTEKIKQVFPALALLIIIVIAFKEIAFLMHPLKHDAIDCSYPWSFFIKTCINDGVFPFWNPYQYLGYPFYGSAQSILWYPVSMLFSFSFPNLLHSISYDFIFHVWMGGVGMLILSKELGFNKKIAFILALSYSLSGFFVGNAQHLYWIVSAAWLPFVITYYLKTISSLRIKHALLTAFFLFLMLAGGYPAFVIILFYIVLAALIIQIAKQIKIKDYKKLQRIVFLHAIMGIFALGLAFTQLVVIFDNFDFSSRGDGLSLAQNLFCPFSFEALISFLFPLLSVKSHVFANTDVSMGNGYIGILVFLFFLLSLFYKKSPKHRFFLITGIVCLIAALGEQFYLRSFLYHYLPFMDSFRFPAAFRLFVIIAFIVSAGFFIQRFLKENSEKLKNTIIIAFSLFLIAMTIVLLDNIKAKPENISLFVKDFIFKEKQNDISIQEILFVQSYFNILIYSVFLAFFIFLKKKKKVVYLFILFAIIDLGTATKLNSAFTVHNPNRTIAELDSFADMHFVEKYSLPNMKTNVIHHSDTSSPRGPIWRNLNNFYGEFSHGGFSSYKNKNLDLLEDSLTQLYISILSNKPIYLSDTVKTYEELSPKDSIHNCDYADIPAFHPGKNDSLRLISFTPNRLEAFVYTENPRLLCLLQAKHKYWTVTVNKKEKEVILVNHLHMGVMTEAGENYIVFEFKAKRIKTAAFINLFFLAFFVFFLIKDGYFPRKKRQNKTIQL